MVIYDTNIWLYLLRVRTTLAHIQRQTPYEFGSDGLVIVPFAVKAELESMSLQFNWGATKRQQLQDYLQYKTIVQSNSEIIRFYAQIDAFSQGRLPTQPTGLSARNMGKNDLWIAATAVAAKALLITTDSDFDHLNGQIFGHAEFRVLKPAL